MRYKSIEERNVAYVQATCRALAIKIENGHVHDHIAQLANVIGHPYYALDEHTALFDLVSAKAQRRIRRLAAERGLTISVRIGSMREVTKLSDGRHFIAVEGRWSRYDRPAQAAPIAAYIVVPEASDAEQCAAELERALRRPPIARDENLLLVEQLTAHGRRQVARLGKRLALPIAVHVVADGELVRLNDGRQFVAQAGKWIAMWPQRARA